MQIQGKTILITGGGSGIGMALARAFLRRGNRVIICGRNPEKLTSAQIKLPGVVAIPCDITQAEAREELFASIRDYYSHIDVLVNNAAVLNFIELRNKQVEMATIEAEINTNLTAPIALTQMFLAQLPASSPAAIINIGAAITYTPVAHFLVYGATKAALHAFSVALRHQLQGLPIEVFEVMPPAVDTAMTEKIALPKMSANKLAQKVVKAIAKGKKEIRIGADTQLMYLLSRLMPQFASTLVNRVINSKFK